MIILQDINAQLLKINYLFERKHNGNALETEYRVSLKHQSNLPTPKPMFSCNTMILFGISRSFLDSHHKFDLPIIFCLYSTSTAQKDYNEKVQNLQSGLWVQILIQTMDSYCN